VPATGWSTQQQSSPVIEAIDARFQERLDQVPVLRKRADDEGITRIGTLDDLVPVLFPHTVYKSYPAAIVDQGRWAQLNKWLESLSTMPIDVDVSGVENVDDWILRLMEHEIYVGASSGTTGKSSFLPKTVGDLDAMTDDFFELFAAAGIEMEPIWHIVTPTPGGNNPVFNRHGMRFAQMFRRPDTFPPFAVPPSEEGRLAFMARQAAVRRAMVEGTASAGQLAAMEAEAAERQALSEEILDYNVDRILERPDEPFMFASFVAIIWRLVEKLQERGLKPGDLTFDNVYNSGGGTKGVELPGDAEEQICALLNVPTERVMKNYGMQELNIGTARCLAGRYHIPEDKLAVLVLDEPGETLVAVDDDGLAQGRAAFFDLTIEGRWGGFISGDRITVDHSDCPCGKPGKTVLPTIERYVNLVDDDKILCAGTMDAYVRGFIGE
jgi:hypothetical protein